MNREPVTVNDIGDLRRRLGRFALEFSDCFHAGPRTGIFKPTWKAKPAPCSASVSNPWRYRPACRRARCGASINSGNAEVRRGGATEAQLDDGQSENDQSSASSRKSTTGRNSVRKPPVPTASARFGGCMQKEFICGRCESVLAVN